MELFFFNDYREYLNTTIKTTKRERGYQSRLANVAGCQKSQFSQILNGHLHLTLDQGARLAEHWGFDENACDYFLTLIELGRAATPSLRSMLSRKLRRLASHAKGIEKRLNSIRIDSQEAAAIYYSSWYVPAIHVLISIENFQTVSQIATRLNLSDQTVENALHSLFQIGLIDKTGSKWQRRNVDLHLPKDSPLTLTNHMNWRHRAISSMQHQQANAVHYTSVFTVSRTDAEKMQHKLLQMISEMRTIVKNSPEEELFSFNCDFFVL